MMTMDGLDELLSRMRDKQIILPDHDVSDDELLYWMLGYTACSDSVLEHIRQIKEAQHEKV
jgi:hypothetical protein